MAPVEHPSSATADEARALIARMSPLTGVSYSWVADIAKGRYDALLKAFDDLDAKAAALLGYLGGGAGLATLGTLFTVLNGQVSPWVIVFTMPAILAASASLWFAARARSTHDVFPPPDAGYLLGVAEEFATDHEPDHERPKAVAALQWDLCAAKMRPVVADKAWYVDRATYSYVAAVFLMVLPLFAALAAPKPAPAPPVVVNVTGTVN